MRPGHDSERAGLVLWRFDGDATLPAAPGGRGRGHEEAAVPLYVIERNFAEQLDPDELDREGIALVNDDVGIRWLYSFLSADRKKTYCLYEAPNPEADPGGSGPAGHPGRRHRPRRAHRSRSPPADALASHHPSRRGETMTTTDTPPGPRDVPAHRRHARPLRRASPDLRPGEPLLRRGLRRAARRRASSTWRSRPSSAAAASGLDDYSQRVRRLGYVAPATALGRQHARLLDRRRRRPPQGRRRLVQVRSSRRPPTATCSPRSTARPATTCRCCCRARRPSGSTAAG